MWIKKSLESRWAYWILLVVFFPLGESMSVILHNVSLSFQDSNPLLLDLAVFAFESACFNIFNIFQHLISILYTLKSVIPAIWGTTWWSCPYRGLKGYAFWEMPRAPLRACWHLWPGCNIEELSWMFLNVQYMFNDFSNHKKDPKDAKLCIAFVSRKGIRPCHGTTVHGRHMLSKESWQQFGPALSDDRLWQGSSTSHSCVLWP